MTRGPQPLAVVLSDEDRVVLERWSRRPKGPHSIAQRARIVLLAADGLTNMLIGERVGVNHTTVTKWRRRFVEGGLDALADEPRPGTPRKFGDDAIEAIVVKTLTERPKGSTHWSTREMACQRRRNPAGVGVFRRSYPAGGSPELSRSGGVVMGVG